MYYRNSHHYAPGLTINSSTHFKNSVPNDKPANTITKVTVKAYPDVCSWCLQTDPSWRKFKKNLTLYRNVWARYKRYILVWKYACSGKFKSFYDSEMPHICSIFHNTSKLTLLYDKSVLRLIQICLNLECIFKPGID